MGQGASIAQLSPKGLGATGAVGVILVSLIGRLIWKGVILVSLIGRLIWKGGGRGADGLGEEVVLNLL